MFYVIIALTLLLLTSCYINYLFLDSVVDQEATIDVGHYDSQSYVYEQMKEHDSHFRSDDSEVGLEPVKVAIYDNNAYWITDDGMLTAPVDENGEVIKSMGRSIDVHSLTTKEVSLLMDILDALKEANDDSGDSGE